MNDFITISSIQTGSMHTINGEFGFVTFCERSPHWKIFLWIEMVVEMYIIDYSNWGYFVKLVFLALDDYENIANTKSFPFTVWYNTRYFTSVRVMNQPLLIKLNVSKSIPKTLIKFSLFHELLQEYFNAKLCQKFLP